MVFNLWTDITSHRNDYKINLYKVSKWKIFIHSKILFTRKINPEYTVPELNSRITWIFMCSKIHWRYNTFNEQFSSPKNSWKKCSNNATPQPHWKKKMSHFDLKSWVTCGIKNRPGIQSNWKIFWVKLTLNIE